MAVTGAKRTAIRQVIRVRVRVLRQVLPIMKHPLMVMARAMTLLVLKI